MNTDELTANEVETNQPEPKRKPICCPLTGNTLFNMIAYAVFIIALGVLYFLHFTAPKPHVFIPKEIVGEPGSGEIVFVNLDTINANYELVAILTGDIQAEMAKQEAIFANKEKTFERKYTQFQENMNAGILTQVQMEHAQQQLMKEYQQLEADKERIFNDLQMRQTCRLRGFHAPKCGECYQFSRLRNAQARKYQLNP